MYIQLPDTKLTESVHFTGDKEKTVIYCDSQSYILLKITLRIYPFKSEVPETITIEYKLMSFKEMATVILGEIIEPYFYKPKRLIDIYDFSNFTGADVIELYKPIEADIVFEEYNYNSNNKIGQQTFYNVNFLRGKSITVSNLSKKEKGKVGINSILSFSIYKDLSNQFILTKNDKTLYTFTSKEKILTTFLYRDSSIQAGNVYGLIEGKNKEYLEKKIVLPKGLQTYHIIWLDENLVLRIFEFTGKFTHNPVHELIFNTYSYEGKEIKHTIEDNKKEKLILNTGFLLPGDIQIIESIIGNLKAWISFDKLKTFTSFCVNTKELNYDSEQNLLNFDIEISLNYEDKEDHYKAHKEIEYDFIFVYKADSEQNNTINLNNVFNSSKDPETIDWGDTQVNSELKHTYTNSGEYTIKVKVRKLTRVTLTHQNVIKITKLPATLTQIDCMGCMFDEPAVNLLLTLVLAHNPSIGHVCSVHSGVEYGVGFLSYIYIGNQRPSIILSQDSINKAKQLLDLNWLVDYFSYFNSNGIPTSSRYQTPGNAQKLWPEDCETLAITDSISIFQKEESTVYMTVDLIGNNLDDTMWNYYAILFEDNGKWTVLKVILGEIDMGTFWEKYSLGSHVGRKNYKIGMLKRIDNVQYPNYSIMWMADFYTYVINEQCVFMRHSNEKNLHYEGIPQSEFFNIFAIGSLSYVGIGKALKDISVEPSIETSPPGTSVTEDVKNKCCWEATEAGDYKFTFVNFNLDFSELESKMSAIPTFYLGFFDANGKLQLKFPVAANWDGTVTVNKEVILSLPTGAKIVPFFHGSWKLPLTYINGYVRLKENSCLIIEKV